MSTRHDDVGCWNEGARRDGHDLRILRGAQGAWQAGCAVETTSGHQQAGKRPYGWLRARGRSYSPHPPLYTAYLGEYE
jgi:hypothetical protein